MKLKLKYSLLTFGLLAAVALIGFDAFESDGQAAATTNPPAPAVDFFGVGTTNGNSTLSWAIVGNRSKGGGAPVVTTLSVGQDASSAYVRFYKVDAGPLKCILATNTSARIYVENTNNSAANWQAGAVIIRHIVDDTYEKRLCTANDGSTNLILTVATLGAMSVGDLVYHCISNSQPTMSFEIKTNTYGMGGPIFVGQKGYPLLVEIFGTAASVNAVGGFYTP
jgi:hypothetical protein